MRALLRDPHPEEHHEVDGRDAQSDADLGTPGPRPQREHHDGRPDQEQPEDEGRVEEVTVAQHPGQRPRQAEGRLDRDHDGQRPEPEAALPIGGEQGHARC